jgi:hypothetical protein
MEDQLSEIESQTFDKKQFQQVFSALERAANEAMDMRDEGLVRDPALRKALSIVETFLRQSGRVCYGGMAINAHLPATFKFYDFNKVLPDYDFFTPQPERDIQGLVSALKAGGFENIAPRVGIHEGTTKIFVNYTAVADISFMPQWLYSILKKRSIVDDGIHYADADFLRMNMYLELSRPRGEVERWEKVYKRLVLLNSVKKPLKHECRYKKGGLTKLRPDAHEAILKYIVDESLIFAGAELERIYKHPNTESAGYVLKSTRPILAYSSSPESHLHAIRQILHEKDPSLPLQNIHWNARGDIIPELFGIQCRGRVLVLLIREQYCHAYNTVKLPGGQELRITSLDSAITLFYTLSYVRGLEGLVPKSIHCFADALVQVSMDTRDKGVPSKFPLFPSACHGHQPSKASLLEAKAQRVAEMKKTRKRKGSLKRGKTQKEYRP